MSENERLAIESVRDLMTSPYRKKPQFLDADGLDKAISAIFRLAMEISVLSDRLATHESLAEKSGVYSKQDVENFEPDSADLQSRKASRDDLVMRLVHDLQ